VNRIVIVIAVVFVLLIAGMPGQLRAQPPLMPGTPVPAITAGRDPAAGEPVAYLGSDGSERARLTVVRVIDPFEATGLPATPGPGFRLVAVEIVVDNTGTKPLAIAPFDILLQDDRGFLCAQLPLAFAGSGPTTGPGAAQVLPGERLAGRVIFQVANPASPVHLFYAPEPGRLVTLADLRLPPVVEALTSAS
jgi:hypothetical protein